MTRKQYKPKPRPSANVITLDKAAAATGQLETACQLWFQNGDPLSTLVLASNAEDCLLALCRKSGKPLLWYEEFLAKMPQSFLERKKYVQDYAKHGKKDIDEATPFDTRSADNAIFMAIKCYRQMFGMPSVLMSAFEFRFIVEHPDIAIEAAHGPIRILREVYRAAAINRQDFLNEFLPTVQRWRQTEILSGADGGNVHLP